MIKRSVFNKYLICFFLASCGADFEQNRGQQLIGSQQAVKANDYFTKDEVTLISKVCQSLVEKEQTLAQYLADTSQNSFKMNLFQSGCDNAVTLQENSVQARLISEDGNTSYESTDPEKEILFSPVLVSSSTELGNVCKTTVTETTLRYKETSNEVKWLYFKDKSSNDCDVNDNDICIGVRTASKSGGSDTNPTIYVIDNYRVEQEEDSVHRGFVVKQTRQSAFFCSKESDYKLSEQELLIP